MSDQTAGVSAQSVAIGEQGTIATPKLRRRSFIEALLFLIPATLFQLFWGWYPLLIAFVISFTDAQPILPSTFTGVESYIRVWRDPLTAQAFVVTLTYSLLSIVLTFILPILIAILLMELPSRFMRWMMLLWFLPLSPIASTVLWKYIYNNQYGLLQSFTTNVLKLPPQPFLGDPKQVLFWLIFPGILLAGPGLVYMAALQGIPSSFYEAAEVEGAGLRRKIWTISLPRLRPIIAMMLIFGIINSMQEFTWPQLMTGGGPEGASRTVVMYMYSLIQNQRFADATALAVMLFALVMAIVVLFRAFYKEDPDA